MEKYEVEITEYLQRTIEVEAESPSDAVDIVEEDYDNCNIVLDYSDFTGKDIEIYNPNKFIPKLDLLMDRIDKYNRDSGLNKARTQEELAKAIFTYANKLFECYKMNDNADLNDVGRSNEVLPSNVNVFKTRSY